MNTDDMITALQACRADASGLAMVCKDCPYKNYDDCITRLREDVITALTPITVKRRIEKTEWNVCSNCNGHLIHKWNYCPYCGRKVKWSEIN